MERNAAACGVDPAQTVCEEAGDRAGEYISCASRTHRGIHAIYNGMAAVGGCDGEDV
jgi:hypothetical protein